MRPEGAGSGPLSEPLAGGTLATLRDIAIGLLRLAGVASIATARTDLSVSVHQAARLLASHL